CSLLYHPSLISHSFFFFNTPPTTELYTLSLHDALPIYRDQHGRRVRNVPESRYRDGPGHRRGRPVGRPGGHHHLRHPGPALARRSEEHTSELQSLTNLVCRLLLEKKNTHHQQYSALRQA